MEELLDIELQPSNASRIVKVMAELDKTVFHDLIGLFKEFSDFFLLGRMRTCRVFNLQS